MRAYALERDVIKVLRRVIRNNDVASMRGTAFIARPVKDVEGEVQRFENRLDESAVRALWSTFERHIIDHAVASIGVHGDSGPFAVSLRDYLTRQVEYARFDDLLDVYKKVVDSNLIGRAKQIKDYRDWIVHRNPRKIVPSTDSRSARDVLGAIIDQLP